jgi:hypothetical protein
VLLDLLLTCRHLSSPMPLTTTTINTPSSTRSNTPTDATLIPLSSTVLDTLLCILVDSSSALRVFEECNGVQAVVKLLKTASAPREVRSVERPHFVVPNTQLLGPQDEMPRVFVLLSHGRITVHVLECPRSLSPTTTHHS